MKPTHTLSVALVAATVLLAGCGKDDDSAQPSTSADSASTSASSTATPPTAAPAVPSDTASASSTAGALSDADKEFVNKAASSGLAEVQASRQIAEKSQVAELKAFAETMVKDHTAANEELMKIAQAKQLTLPTAPVAEHKDAIAKVSGAAGPASEQAYVEEFGVKAHKEAVALFEKQAASGTDPELKQFAESKLPRLREHLQHAEQLAQNTKK